LDAAMSGVIIVFVGGILGGRAVGGGVIERRGGVGGMVQVFVKCVGKQSLEFASSKCLETLLDDGVRSFG
jgi:hypothetical protein